MPTNSFSEFFLSWMPERGNLVRPYYLSLANMLEADITSGKLASGTKLPPQRELADYLDINFTTVTQAYNLCREKNLIYGVIGRGTFVAPLPGKETPGRKVAGKVIELGLVNGFAHLRSPVIEASRSVLQKGYINELYSYTEPAGHLHQRAAGAHWMNRMDVHTDSEHTAIFSGAQNVISTALLSLFRIGDKLAVDEYTYSNLIGTARLSHIRLAAVRNDRDGMIPEDLEKVCQDPAVRGIFLMPNCANPTTCTIPEKRKDELSAIIARRRLILIEDDNTGILPPQTGYHSMFSRLPEQTIYICNCTTILCGGLRVAFAAFPEQFRLRLLNAQFHLNIKTSSLDAEIITELILSGKAARIADEKSALAEKRNQLFDEIFPNAVKPGTPAAFFRWLPLPEMPIRGVDIERALLQKNVNVYSSYRFSTMRHEEEFLRLAISSPENDSDLCNALNTVKDFIQQNS